MFTETAIINKINDTLKEYRDKFPDISYGELSDGYHTFNQLYHQRAVLFAVICNRHKNLAYKSKYHSDGSMYEGMFIVGIQTPKGQISFHYNIDPYWDYFKVNELKTAPIWDGHTEEDTWERLSSLLF